MVSVLFCFSSKHMNILWFIQIEKHRPKAVEKLGSHFLGEGEQLLELSKTGNTFSESLLKDEHY